MFHFDAAADMFAAFDASLEADFDLGAPLTASDLSLQQLGQGFNSAKQWVWQCSNCCALNVPVCQFLYSLS